MRLDDFVDIITLGRVYGSQKFDAQSLYYFNPHMSFDKYWEE